MTANLPRVVLVPCLLVAVAGWCTGCKSSSERQHMRQNAMRVSAGQHFDQMVTNAALHDRSVADVHFIAHSSELSGAGELRLNRLASILNTYGGTLRYDTVLTDDALIKARLSNVSDYLSLVGCDMARVNVAVMRSGGHGMTAAEAIAKNEQGTQPEQQTGGGGMKGMIPGPVSQER